MATTFLEAGSDATQGLEFYPWTSALLGTIGSDNTTARTGPRSIKSNGTSLGANAYVVTPNGTCADAGRCVSFGLRVSTAAPSVETPLAAVQQASDGNPCVVFGINTDGTLRINGAGVAKKSGTTVLVANTWYRVSISYVLTSTTNWTAKLYLNGVLEATTSNADGTLTRVGSSGILLGIASGAISGTTAAIMTAWYDDIYIDDRTDLTDCGNIRVTHKRPVSNGTTNGFTTQIGAGGSGYGSGHTPQVNEQPLSTTNGWSLNTASAITEEYTIEGQSVGDVDITGNSFKDFVAWLYAKSATAQTSQLIIAGSASNISTTSTATLFTKAAASTTYPAGGTDVGMISAAVSDTYSLYECGVLVAYQDAAWGPLLGLQNNRLVLAL